MTSGRSRVAVVALLALATGGCGPVREPGRDLEAIRRRGTLRVAVPPWTGEENLPDGAGPGVLRRLADRIGVRLELLRVRPLELTAAVEAGRADLAVSRFGPWGLAERGLVATAPIEWVDDVVVESPRTALAGRRAVPGLWLHRGDPYWSREEGATAGRVRYPLPDELPPEEVLRRVAAGRYGATVVDTGMLASVPALAGRLRVAGTAVRERAVAWVVPASAVNLRRAVDDVLFAERLARGHRGPLACRDLPEVLRVRRLRLITRDGPATCTVERGGIAGFHYELARRLGLELRVQLELVLTGPGTDPLRWLEEGRGDLVALHDPVPMGVEGRVVLTPPLRWVSAVGVVRGGREPPEGPDALAGRRVAAPAGWASRLALFELNPPPEIVPAEDGVAAITAVARGWAEVAVVDEDTARLVLADRPGLHAGPAVLASEAVRWVLRTDQPRLARRIAAFLRRAAADGTLRVLASAELELRARRRGRRAPPFALTPWDAQLKRAALEVGIDWRLLAALAYEESRFDPAAVGPGGSAGLFQFMPATWRWLGIRDPFDPEEAIPAAARYLRQLMDEFPDAPFADRVAMALAAYNVGPGHVHDARRLARRMGLDPDRWRDSVETAMLLLDEPEVARRFPSGPCRCRRAVHYARRILRRYFLYAEQFPPGAPVPPAAVPQRETARIPR